ncbi:methionyl aminopeptidase [Brevibacterium sanguinis]|uniref:Methionine aminopeptidase n=2 Tax=Brevibacterium TaxID=1696 RepID=A0A366IGK1_9MICO|nr:MULTISPECIES: type I methionyl aminopeptidase [Brevibacterium]RBP63126.1 methionyl aminopeptidase [Brevibacterium sanguinis]RBP69698.1 methionyl aminopeptidase [Brevibacterium celere]
MIELKTPAEIDKMAVTGRFVAKTLAELCATAEPGMNLLHLENRARKLIEDAGAVSCYWDYAPSFGSGPFRNVICLSVNDGVLHGKPHDYVMRNGDLLTLDFAVSIDGWVADAARSVVVGEGSEEDQRLIDSTWTGLEAGISAAQPGNRLGDISQAIGDVADSLRIPVNLDFGGHGLGHTMHEDPHVPNRGKGGRGMVLKPGLTLAIEPWWSLTSKKLKVDKDGWTLRLADGSNGAHSENTIAVTEDGPRVLTVED